MKKKIFVYGTLREGGRLRPSYPMTTLEKGITARGFKMIDSGYGYPIAIETDEDYQIVGDIVEADTELFARVARMEEMAGYYTKKLIIHNQPAAMFLQHGDTFSPNLEHIEDWLKYVENGIRTENSQI